MVLVAQLAARVALGPLLIALGALFGQRCCRGGDHPIAFLHQRGEALDAGLDILAARDLVDERVALGFDRRIVDGLRRARHAERQHHERARCR